MQHPQTDLDPENRDYRLFKSVNTTLCGLMHMSGELLLGRREPEPGSQARECYSGLRIGLNFVGFRVQSIGLYSGFGLCGWHS